MKTDKSMAARSSNPNHAMIFTEMEAANMRRAMIDEDRRTRRARYDRNDAIVQEQGLALRRRHRVQNRWLTLMVVAGFAAMGLVVRAQVVARAEEKAREVSTPMAPNYRAQCDYTVTSLTPAQDKEYQKQLGYDPCTMLAKRRDKLTAENKARVEQELAAQKASITW